MTRTALGLPPALARRANRVVRPRDAAHVYANPRAELGRLVDLGLAVRLAVGYYVLTPQARLGDTRWLPGLEPAALGLAQADYGTSMVSLMGVSAARHHGAIPRAIAVAVVAVPKQRPALRTAAGRIVFVKRDVVRLDVERMDTDITQGWVTTVEQTLLDLAARPTLGGLVDRDVEEAIRVLASRADWDGVADLARDQHKPAAIANARRLTGRPNA